MLIVTTTPSYSTSTSPVAAAAFGQPATHEACGKNPVDFFTGSLPLVGLYKNGRTASKEWNSNSEKRLQSAATGVTANIAGTYMLATGLLSGNIVSLAGGAMMLAVSGVANMALS